MIDEQKGFYTEAPFEDNMEGPSEYPGDASFINMESPAGRLEALSVLVDIKDNKGVLWVTEEIISKGDLVGTLGSQASYVHALHSAATRRIAREVSERYSDTLQGLADTDSKEKK